MAAAAGFQGYHFMHTDKRFCTGCHVFVPAGHAMVAPGPGSFKLVSALAGVGAGLLNPAQQATVADVVGNQRSGGKVHAGFQMAQDTGAIIGPVAAGALADAFGFHVAFGLSGLIVLLAGVGWLFAREPMHRGAAGN